MKKIILIALAFVSLHALAQDPATQRKDFRKQRMEDFQAMTAEELGTLQTKRMTLHLDLTDSQRNQIQSLNLEEAKYRKAKMEERKTMKDVERKSMTKDERVAKMNERLDRQIAMKAKMKEILNEEQFTKWEESQSKGRRGDRAGKRQPMKRNKQ